MCIAINEDRTNVQIELHTEDIPDLFQQFSSLVGSQHWKKRVDLIKSEAKGNRLLRDYLLDANSIAFGLQSCSELTSRFGRIPVKDMDCSAIYPCMALAAQVLSIAESSSPIQARRLARRVHGALKNPDDMRALLLELTAATHFLRRGLKISWPEMKGTGNMDLLVEGIGISGLEVECKSISNDKGKKIHREEAIRFYSLLAPGLNSMGKDLRSGVAAVLTLDDRLPTAFSDRKKLAHSITKHVLSGLPVVQLDEETLRVTDFESSRLGGIGANGIPVITRTAIDEITNTCNQQAMIVGRKSGGAIVFVIQSSCDDSLLSYIFATASRSASNQFSKARAGLFLIGLEGIEAESLMEIAKQDSDIEQPPTALRRHVSDFLSGQKRDHVVGVSFISKGRLRPTTDGQHDSGGTAYVFSKRESPYWHDDFNGLFNVR
jgi:hypothetical protein